MRWPAAALAAALVAGTVPAAAGVFVVKQPDGSTRVVNVPDMQNPGVVPQGSSSRREALWPTVRDVAQRHGLDPRLVDLVIRMESGYDPRAVSPKGARGVMQLMPDTARAYSVLDVFDPVENIRGGVRYLSDLMNRFGSDVGLALAAYNAGPQAVDRYGGVPPFEETRRYVNAILASYSSGGGAVLSGGFGQRSRQRPVQLTETSGGLLLSNARRVGEASVGTRLRLR